MLLLATFGFVVGGLAGCGASAGAGDVAHRGTSGDAPERSGCDEPCEGADCTEPYCADRDHPRDVVDPNDPSLEIDPQICQVDADCLVGTPRDCCTGFCPEHAVAWSHEAWLRYQEECAVEECVVMETLACQPDEGGPPPTARCVAERCVLR